MWFEKADSSPVTYYLKGVFPCFSGEYNGVISGFLCFLTILLYLSHIYRFGNLTRVYKCWVLFFVL